MNSFANRNNHKDWSIYLPPSGAEDIYRPNLELFFRMIFERQEIYYRRHIQKLPPPWTLNPFLRDFRFTNVYRQNDRSSQWLINNIIRHLPDDPKEQIWKIICYRLYNNPDTFTGTGIDIPSYYDYDVEDFYRKIDNYKRSGKNPFTNAYLINAMNANGRPRHELYSRQNLPAIHAAVPGLVLALRKAEEANNPLIFIREITKLPNIALFIAHEFYQDFTYIPMYSPSGKPLMKFTQDDYTNVGPGCSVGIRIIFPNCKNIAEQEAKIYELRDMAKAELRKLGHFKYIYWNREKECYQYKPLFNLSAHQIEFSLCEFGKYFKLGLKMGKQRSKFKPK